MSERTPEGVPDPDAPVEAVLFDIDGTLCEYVRDGEELLSLAFEEVGVAPFFDVEDYYDRFGDAATHHDTVDDIREHCFAELADARGHDPDVGRAVADAYAAERDHANVEFVPGAERALERMRDRYAVGAVTNGGPGMQRAKLSGLGVADAFETVVYAGHEVPAKPDPAPFERALASLGVPPERTVHVGNSLRSDVQGAVNAGVRAAWLTDGEGGITRADVDPTPAYLLDSMREFAAEPWR